MDMSLTPLLANLTWAASSTADCLRFHHALEHPAETQSAILRQLLSRHADTAYGRAHRFSDIRGYAEFHRRVPLVDYEDLEPWIERIRAGEPAVLTSDPVRRLLPTGGSSGARKLIPFTAGLQQEFNRAIGPWMLDLFRQYPSLLTGPAYWSITPAIPDEPVEHPTVPIGFDNDSRYLGGLRHRLVDSILAVPSALRLVKDTDMFRYLTLLCLIRSRDLRLISVWHPSFLTLLLDALPEKWEHLLNDLKTDGCSRAASLPDSVLASLKLRALPDRANDLRTANPHQPETIWPELQLISCWGDGGAGPTCDELRERFPRATIQPKGLLATEAFMTLPFASQHPLAVRSHFFEFLDDRGQTHLTEDLIQGETYEVVVTTGGGLWRYRMRDRVEVSGFVKRTPSLRFIGRAGNVCDCCGEKLSEAFVTRVLSRLIAALPVRPRFVLLAPDRGDAGGFYTLHVEGTVPMNFARLLDEALRQNPQYAWCRDLGQLREPRLFKIHEGGHESFITREMSHGRRMGDVKPTFLSHRDGWRHYFSGEFVREDDRTQWPARTNALTPSGV
jgi:hypothetical protein